MKTDRMSEANNIELGFGEWPSENLVKRIGRFNKWLAKLSDEASVVSFRMEKMDVSFLCRMSYEWKRCVVE